MAPPGPGTDGQSTSGTTEVGLLSGHGRPGPGGLHILPSNPGRRFVIRTRSRGQLSEGPGRGPAAGRAKPRRTKLPITAETPERYNPQPTYPHSGEVLSDGESQEEDTPTRGAFPSGPAVPPGAARPSSVDGEWCGPGQPSAPQPPAMRPPGRWPGVQDSGRDKGACRISITGRSPSLAEPADVRICGSARIRPLRWIQDLQRVLAIRGQAGLADTAARQSCCRQRCIAAGVGHGWGLAPEVGLLAGAACFGGLWVVRCTSPGMSGWRAMTSGPAIRWRRCGSS